ncbi:MAG: NAD(P)/FAD-dependent oxidoreductase [Acidobacteria bacterium]|nr:MAG: NAD(P)/FAD-dependent oxidoreductase [Acidobacteriota bacterium]
MSEFDTTVVGAGPNGLAAAVEMALAGRKVLVVEGADEIGGGTRTEELTLPGFIHDVCSAIHPTGVASPFFKELKLDIDWIQPPIPLSHPLDGGRSVGLHRSVEETASQLGVDESTYIGLMGPLSDGIDEVIEDIFGPLTLNPRHKAKFARIAAIGSLPASLLVKRFKTGEARALIAGLAAHSIAPFSAPATSAVGLILGAIGHSYGWPFPKGGSSRIAQVLADRLERLGGTVETGRWVESVSELPGGVALLDVMPPAAYRMAKDRLSPSSLRRLPRWRPGPGVFKVDWALDEPIPWADPLSGRAATVHLGGSYEEVEAAERDVFNGEHPDRPFVLMAQQSQFDDTRAPDGKHTAWGYCHVPNGSELDMTEAIESQIERFAPGFKDIVLERATRNAVQYQNYNPNYIGGDIGGGRYGLRKIMQMGAKRPYQLGGGVYLCSSATPPGAGVHGMCGYYAARAAIG